MTIEIKQPAMQALEEIANWVEERNSLGSGERYLEKFYLFIQSYAVSAEKVPLCKFPEFKAAKLKCIFFGDWVISFKIIDKKFVIYTVVHGSWLNY